MALSIETTVEIRRPGTAVVTLTGRLDISSAGEVKRLFGSTVGAGNSQLVVDLAGVTYIDSSGLSALVSGLRAARQAGGDLRIAAAGEQPSALFVLTSLDQVFKLSPTVEEALSGYDE